MKRFRIRNAGWVAVIVIALAVIATGWPGFCFACSCAAPPSVDEAAARSAAVFAGSVLAVNEVRKFAGWHGFAPAFTLSREVELEVTQSWKGSPPQRVKVMTGSGGGDCGYEFRAGESYLVYAGEHEGLLQAGICGRTKRWADAGADLQALGSGQSALPGGTVDDGSVTPWLLWAASAATAALLLLIVLRRFRRLG